MLAIFCSKYFGNLLSKIGLWNRLPPGQCGKPALVSWWALRVRLVAFRTGYKCGRFLTIMIILTMMSGARISVWSLWQKWKRKARCTFDIGNQDNLWQTEYEEHETWYNHGSFLFSGHHLFFLPLDEVTGWMTWGKVWKKLKEGEEIFGWKTCCAQLWG